MSEIWLCTKKPRLNFDSSVLSDLSEQELLQISAHPHMFWAAKKNLYRFFFFSPKQIISVRLQALRAFTQQCLLWFYYEKLQVRQAAVCPSQLQEGSSPWMCSADPSRACSSAEGGQNFSSNMALGIKRDLSRHHWSKFGDSQLCSVVSVDTDPESHSAPLLCFSFSPSPSVSQVWSRGFLHIKNIHKGSSADSQQLLHTPKEASGLWDNVLQPKHQGHIWLIKVGGSS